MEGVPPLARAVASGQLAARLASSLGDEAAVVVSRIIPISQGSGETAANQLSKAISGALPGRLAFPETQTAGGGAGRSSAPLRDFASTRTGWESPISGPTLYAHLFSEVAEICGVPGALVNPTSAGPAAREAFRRLTVGTIEPYARLLESELSRVLERTVTIKLRRLGGVDAAGRARALHVLTEAGFDARGRAGTPGVGLRWRAAGYYEDSEIDPLELPVGLRDFSRAMAGEKALSLTDDRHIILLSAAAEIELYVGKMIFRGAGGAARVATSVVEVEAPFTAPAVGALPRSTGVTVTAVEIWDDDSEAFAPSTYIRRPLGLILVPRAGTFRITASVLPAANFPAAIGNAVALTFSYREEYRPRHSASDLSDGAAPSVAGAILRSGAAEALRFYRVPGV